MPRLQDVMREEQQRSEGGIPSSHDTYQITASAPPPRATTTPPSRSDRALQAFGGKLQRGAFVLTDVGLVIDETQDVKPEDWQEVGAALKTVSRAFVWLLADWMNQGELHRWGTKYEEIARWSGYSEKSLREYCSVANRVVLSIRMDKLSFGHHQVVAALPPNLQSGWLTKALENKWSVKRLAREMGDNKPTPASDRWGTVRFSHHSRRLARFVEQYGDVTELDYSTAEQIAQHIREVRRWADDTEEVFKQKHIVGAE